MKSFVSVSLMLFASLAFAFDAEKEVTDAQRVAIFKQYVSLQDGGSLLIAPGAADSLEAQALESLEHYVTTINESIFKGERMAISKAEFQSDSLAMNWPPITCQCSSCCINNICWAGYNLNLCDGPDL